MLERPDFSRSMRLFALGALLCTTVSASIARADFKALTSRLPEGANAIVLIDVEKILNSPMGTREGWREKLADAYEEKPMIVPPEAKQVVMGAWLNIRDVQPAWEVSVMRLTEAPSMEDIASSEQGYLDRLAGKVAAYSPIGAFFLQLDADILASVSPADRQFAVRWARLRGSSGGTELSTYLRDALERAEQGAAFVMALDLEEAFDIHRIKARMASGSFSSMDGQEKHFEAMAPALASLRGAMLTVKFGDNANGELEIAFGQDASALAQVAKPLFFEILARSGMSINDLKSWKFEVQGSSFRGEGSLSGDGLRRLFSVVDAPTPVGVKKGSGKAKSKPAKPKKDKADGDADVVAASQKYFRTVSAIVDKLEGGATTAPSMSHFATWIRRDARRINRLPIVNVDPDLVAWGGDVAVQLNDVAQIFSTGGLSAQSRTAGVSDVYTPSEWSDASGGYTNDRARVERQNAINQRRAAAKEEQAKVAQAASGVVRDMAAQRAAIRAEMTKRYKAEFGGK